MPAAGGIEEGVIEGDLATATDSECEGGKKRERQSRGNSNPASSELACPGRKDGTWKRCFVALAQPSPPCQAAKVRTDTCIMRTRRP